MDLTKKLIHKSANLEVLQKAGMVKPDTSPDYEESFRKYALMDCIFRTSFEAGNILSKKHVFLCFEGLDTVCSIFLNGRKIGDTENCHTGYSYNVTKKLRAGKNDLVVIIRSPVKEAQKRCNRSTVKFPNRFNHSFMYIRKPAYSFHWDWGPAIPTSGIFRPVYLLGYDEGFIDNFYVRYKISGKQVAGTVDVQARAPSASKAQVKIGGKTFTAPVRNGKARVRFSVRSAKLWYPNGYGRPNMYNMDISLNTGDGALLDRKRHRIGFRTVQVVINEKRADKKADRFFFRINGKEVFCTGYNWIPIDNDLPRGYYDRYRKNLDLAKLGNTNMLRIWGGGFYEDDEFYKMCDERGIMVWQDGAFACAFYPDHDPHFMKLVKEELEYNIKRLRNFTSLVIWRAMCSTRCAIPLHSLKDFMVKEFMRICTQGW
jgi:beta-mannosidase